MVSSLLLLLLLVVGLAHGCRPSYDTVYGGVCSRDLGKRLPISSAIEACTHDGTFPPSREAAVDGWNPCPPPCVDGDSFYLDTNIFKWMKADKDGMYYAICQQHRRINLNSPCDYYAPFLNSMNKPSECYKKMEMMVDWFAAEKECGMSDVSAHLPSIHSAETNAYLRRLSVDYGIKGSLNIGYQFDSATNTSMWTDKSMVDYEIFGSGFPIDKAGFCSSMNTASPFGYWQSTLCNMQFPFFCAMPAFDTANQPMPHCNGLVVLQENDHFYSPGFPRGMGGASCPFYVGVPTGKRVVLEVVHFSSNSCCDQLVIQDGNPAMNKTETIVTGSSFPLGSRIRLSSLSNGYYMNWRTGRGDATTKGFHLIVRGETVA